MESKLYRAVGYKRVSAREQLEGHSLDAQEVHIRSFVESQGWVLVNIYADAGISAKKGSRRPGLEQMLQDAKGGKFDVVVVDKIDRFYRHLGSLLSALDHLNECSVSFASVQEKLDFTTPWGKLMLTVLGMLAEIYLDNLRQETKKGYRQRAREGLWSGSIPYGYCNGLCSNCDDPNGKGYCPNYGQPNIGNGKCLVPHPIESEVVKLVFDWYASGGYSDRTIADKLNHSTFTLPDGCEVPIWQKGLKGANRPRLFGRDLIRDMISRQAYTGKLPYKGVDSHGKHRKRKAAIEVWEGKHPALITDEIFEKAQQVRELLYRGPRQPAAAMRVYPLTGILRCGYCGGRMRGESNYRYTFYQDGGREDHSNECEQPMILARPIEDRILRVLHDILEEGTGKEDFSVFSTQLTISEERYRRAQELYIAGSITRDVLESEKYRLESVRKDLRLTNVDATIALYELVQSGLSNWSELSLVEKKRLLRLALEAAWVQDNALVAVEPTVAYLPLMSGIGCTMGDGGIRTLGGV